jgi:predicted Rossmann fold nucleotide-binding protein DprA/Smf involved in DNA uptake
MFNSFQKLKDGQIHIIGLDDERYPQSVIEKLKQNSPPVLFCKGYLPLLNTKGVSIVGSRDVSDAAGHIIILFIKMPDRVRHDIHFAYASFP